MNILNTISTDIDTLFELYEAGTNYQKSVANKHWKGFDRDLVLKEIEENRQWKLVEGDEIAAIFCTSFDDPFIWAEKNNDPAVYLHRITTNPAFRGQGLLQQIIAWVKDYASQNGKRFIRLDTGSGNDKLNNYYVSCGFTYLGVTEIKQADNLPEHYKDGTSSLFELDCLTSCIPG